MYVDVRDQELEEPPIFHTVRKYVRNSHWKLDSFTAVTYISYGCHKVWRRLIRLGGPGKPNWGESRQGGE
jgi:hypothetical protein